MAAPRIVHLLHGSFESDPRVRRHTGAAIAAGYRVSVLLTGSVETSADHAAHLEAVDVRSIGSGHRTLAGQASRRVQGALRRVRRRKGDGPAVADSKSIGSISTPNVTKRNANSWRDLLEVALLVRQNVVVYRHGRQIGGRLVHANDLNTLLAGVLLARAWRAPLVYDSHELWVETSETWSPLYRRLVAAYERVLVRNADAVVTVNSAVARALANQYGIKIPTVIMNCPPFDGRRIERSSDADSALKVVYLGMLNEGRGLQELIAAAKATKDISLTIYGHGPLALELAKTTNATYGPGTVRLEGAVPVESVVEVLRTNDVGVIPYPDSSINTRLSSPVKLFEYMSAGLAIVASDLPVMRDIINSCHCGLLTVPANSSDIADKLKVLAADRKRAHTLGEAAYQAAATRYNAETEHRRLLNVYRAVGLPRTETI